MSGVQAGVKVISRVHGVHASSSPTNSSICSATWGPIGQPGEVSVKAMLHVAALDLHLVDQAELHEIEPQLGVDDVRERLLDVVHCHG